MAKIYKIHDTEYKSVEALSDALKTTLLFFITDLECNNTSGIDDAKIILSATDLYLDGPEVLSASFIQLEKAISAGEKLLKHEEIINAFEHLNLPNYSKHLLRKSHHTLSDIEKKFLDVIPPSPLKVKKQQPMEREIMDDNFKSGKGSLKLEFRDITDPIEVGKTILDARKAAGLSQNQLVEKSNNNVSLRTISKLESGKAKHVPQMTTLVEIAKATGMKLKITLES